MPATLTEPKNPLSDLDLNPGRQQPPAVSLAGTVAS